MSDPTDSKVSTTDPLDAIIAEYVQQVEAGAIPDREALITGHPDLAERLRAFFADYDRLDRQAGELRLSADPNRTTDQAPPGADATGLAGLPRVRYFGDYELLEVIARGGMGVVYKARQVSLNRLVALKMILKGELATPREVARFRAGQRIISTPADCSRRRQRRRSCSAGPRRRSRRLRTRKTGILGHFIRTKAYPDFVNSRWDVTPGGKI